MNKILSLSLLLCRFVFLTTMVLALTYAVMPIKWIFAGSPASNSSWGTTYEADPTGSDPLSEGDNWIRQLKIDIRKRAAVEHQWGVLSGSPTTDNGRHLEGSARAFYEATCPSVLPRADYNNTGGATSVLLDSGRICRDSTTGELKINSTDGSATWVQAITALSGTITLLNTPLFSKSSVTMDIFAHAARHRVGGVDGTWINALDGIPFAIQQILTDTSFDTTGCPLAAVNSTAFGSQVFGEAGDACFAISTGLDFHGRTGNSKVFVMGTVTFSNGGAVCEMEAGIYLDSMSTQIGVAGGSGQDDSDNGNREQIVTFGYTATVSGGAAHEIALHISDFIDDGCASIQGGQLIVVDLGNS